MTLAQDYAKALFDMKGAGTKTDAHGLIGAFIASLKRRGHLKLIPRIYAEYGKLAFEAERRRPKLLLANEGEKKNAATCAHQFLPANTAVEVCVDPLLVSGFVVSGSDFRYDTSGRRSLIELYHTLIATR